MTRESTTTTKRNIQHQLSDDSSKLWLFVLSIIQRITKLNSQIANKRLITLRLHLLKMTVAWDNRPWLRKQNTRKTNGNYTMFNWIDWLEERDTGGGGKETEIEIDHIDDEARCAQVDRWELPAREKECPSRESHWPKSSRSRRLSFRYHCPVHYKVTR